MRQPIPFGKYLLLDRVSVGGMAEVFKAKSYGVEGFEKVIAIKRILPSMGEDRDFIKMFIDEAKIAGQLSHANICQIFELGRTDGSHFIAMEYIWGKDLLQISNRFKKLGQVMPVDMACFVVSKVCEGLDYAHRKKDAMGRPLQIVHRDCSPQNVLVSYEGEVKIIDFGIAKAASRSSRTQAGVLKGKFGYMSPEQVRGLPLDRRSDVFALGTILYESLTGERLFMGESDFSTLEKVRNVDIQPPTALNRNIPAEVETIVMRALTRDADERYQWASEMRAELQQYLMTRPEVFTAKSLSGWLRQGFAAELEHERRSMEQYKHLGRDGLIAGMPQAQARLDVVQHLGQAGPAEGDPTTLGGPNFEEMMADQGLPLASGKQHGSEFGEEAPTELFGEIGPGGAEDERPTHDQLRPVLGPPPAAPPLAAAPSVVLDLGSAGNAWGGNAAQAAQQAAGLARAAAEAPTISPAAGLSLPDLSALAGMPAPAISFTPAGMPAATPGGF
ncbi:MAG TPA: serine/threonine-protein kinase, partial [Kofleriaceae bacterium]|nr:serine/threonine-protein kinase [Kofleriaceae bacterium]